MDLIQIIYYYICRKEGESKNNMRETTFSIIIPSWNNLPYLSAAINSIKEYSSYEHEIIVHVNEGTDDTIKWLKNNNIPHTYSKKNVGVCEAFNTAYTLTSNNRIVFFNDDMIALPKWDEEIFDFEKQYDFTDKVFLSSTMIQPEGSHVACISPYDYGSTIEDFRKEDLLNDLEDLRNLKEDVNGSTWPPTILYRNTLDKIRGFSESYPLGWGSDPDLAKKIWDLGGRNFVGVGRSLVYHFMQKTTNRAAKHYPKKMFKKTVNRINGGEISCNAARIFYDRYGVTVENFTFNMLGRNEQPWEFKKDISQ
jgi:glycosyltransferase involved in cell wall biosynthesis